MRALGLSGETFSGCGARECALASAGFTSSQCGSLADRDVTATATGLDGVFGSASMQVRPAVKYGSAAWKGWDSKALKAFGQWHAALFWGGLNEARSPLHAHQPRGPRVTRSRRSEPPPIFFAKKRQQMPSPDEPTAPVAA